MVKKGLAELEQFTLTRGAYAKRLGITPNAVRMRMRHGNLSGQFRFDGNKYLFKEPKRPRDYIVKDHSTLTTQKRKYNRGNHFKADYPNDAFKLHNEMKMLNKIKGKFKNEEHEREFNKINEAGLKKAYKQSREQLKVAAEATMNPQDLKDYGAMLTPIGLKRVEEKGYYGIRRPDYIDTSYNIRGKIDYKKQERLFDKWAQERNSYETVNPYEPGQRSESGVEINLSHSSPAPLDEPRFSNKIEESIWRLKNKK
tara:strand:+ start:4440 stop:5204 length:765 start_codon:yes stop_codon:yes gene_type:complete